MRPSTALLQNIEKVRSILAECALTNPRIFGSVAREEDTEGSDLDLLVEKADTGFSWRSRHAAASMLDRTLDIPVEILVEGHNEEKFLKKIRPLSISLDEFVAKAESQKENPRKVFDA